MNSNINSSIKLLIIDNFNLCVNKKFKNKVFLNNVSTMKPPKKRKLIEQQKYLKIHFIKYVYLCVSRYLRRS